MTERRTIFLPLSQYVFNDIESSSDEEDDLEFQNEEMLALIGATPIEHHPRQVGYLNLIPLYSDADFFRNFRITRTPC